MELDQYEEPAISGLVSLFFAVVITYGVAMVYPTSNLQWTLTAVGFASFFSGFFSNYEI